VPALRYSVDLRMQYGTGSAEIWKTRHEVSVDIRIFFTVYVRRWLLRDVAGYQSPTTQSTPLHSSLDLFSASDSNSFHVNDHTTTVSALVPQPHAVRVHRVVITSRLRGGVRPIAITMSVYLFVRLFARITRNHTAELLRFFHVMALWHVYSISDDRIRCAQQQRSASTHRELRNGEV